MNSSFINIEKLIADWKKLQPLNGAWQTKLDKKFKLEFNYNSNHIEGNTLTYLETELLLIFGDTNGNHTFRETSEMKAHDTALLFIKQWALDKERTLNEADIKDLNKIILVEPYWKEAITMDGNKTERLIKIGDYKEFPNSVRLENGEIFEYATVTDTPIKMSELVTWFKENEKLIHPVKLAAQLHYKFVRIHPFDDGNGRIARLLMNYTLYKHDLPPVIIKSEEKKEYLNALHRADAGDIEFFEDYLAKQLEWSLKLAIKAGLGEEIEESKDWRKQLELSKKLAEVTPIFTKSIAINIIENVVYKLISKINNSLKPFESLFDDKIQILNGTKVNDIDFLLKILIHYNFENGINYVARNEKKILNQRYVFSYEIYCMFKDNHYSIDIKISHNKEVISGSYNDFKYNQIISDAKIESIVDLIGSNLAKFVESNIVMS